MEKSFVAYGLKIALVIMSVFFSACQSEELPGDATTPSVDEEAACFVSGDILVSSSGNDSVVAFNSSGVFKKTIFSLNIAAGEAIYGLQWLPATSELAIVIDGSDRVMAVSAADCTARNLIVDSNLTGTVRGITQISGGDILVVETNNIERFTTAGVRVTSGGWPLTLQTTGTEVSAISAGGFVHCSTGTDVVRIYNAAGAQTATRSSGIAATTDAAGCKVLADGTIATAWSGTTDTVSIYNSTLSASLFTYSNTSVLGTPGGIGQKTNGNILIVDRVFHHVVEITNQGVYVATIGAGFLNTPEHVTVVP